MASQPGVFNPQQFTDAGAPAYLYRLYTYVQGTTTQKVAYTDAAETVAHTYTSDGAGGQYIALNARGELPAPLFLSPGPYDLTLKTPSGATVWTRYAVGGGDTASALATDLTDTSFSTKGAALVAFEPTLNYAAKTIGFAEQSAPVNVAWFLSAAQKADVAARSLVLDLTTAMQAAHDWANGRPVRYPAGAYRFSAIALNQVGDGIVGDHSGGMTGSENGTLLVSTVTGTSAAITLRTSYAHNVLLSNFTLKQNSGSKVGRGVSLQDCYWLRTDNLRITGFTDNLYASLSIYHHHKRLFSENSTNGVNYWGNSGTWNTDWFNNDLTFDSCRFTDCTVTGASIKGCEVVFINPDFSNQSTVGAIGCKIYGESTSFRAHGISIQTPYVEATKIAFSFSFASVEISGGGFVQGGTIGTPATSIVDASNSTVYINGVEDKDYWDFGYRLTNGTTLTMRQLFSGSIRTTEGTADATSSFTSDASASGSFTLTLTGCTASVTGTASWERRGNTVRLLIPALSGTSNADTAALTGMPVAIRPLTEQFGLLNLTNNSADAIGSFRLFTSGTINIHPGVVGALFATSGTKGVRATSIEYLVT